jgi:hypothetical protein
MGKYREAKKFNETLLKLEESNPQALSLRTLINDKVQTGNSPLCQVLYRRFF